MEIVITFEGCAALRKMSVDGHFSHFLPHEIFKKLTGLLQAQLRHYELYCLI